MRRRRVILCFLLLVVAGGALVLLTVPVNVLIGILRSEPFYEGLPASHWREVLREDGRAGFVQDSTKKAFLPDPAALRVLRFLQDDPDRDVRAPAVFLLGRCGHGKSAALDGIREAMNDTDVGVRLSAIVAANLQGTFTEFLAPDLARLARDPEPQVRHLADGLLWSFDVPSALKAGGWEKFKSDKWRFEAVFPGTPAERLGRRSLWCCPLPPVTFFSSEHGAIAFGIGASPAPRDDKMEPDEAWFDSGADLAAFMARGHRTGSKLVFQHGLMGREYRIEAPNDAIVRVRTFWVAGVSYSVVAAFQDRSFRVSIPSNAKRVRNTSFLCLCRT
jgi:hypothetical protein